MALWLEADRMRSLEVTDKNFENQRDAVKEEKGMRVDNAPYAGAILDFMASVWAGTGYGHPVIGSLADLDAAQTKDVQAFFDRYYTPNNAVMAIVGDVDLAEVKAKVEKYFGDIPRGADRAPFPAVDHTQTKIEEVKEDALARQPLYLMGWKTVPEHHADAPALELLMNVLLRGDSSRITKILKDDKKLVVASLPLGGFGGGRDAGMSAAAFIPVEGKAFEDIKAVVVEQVAQLKKKGITPKELKKLVAQVTVDTVESLSTNNGRAGMIANDGLFYGDPKHVLTQLEKYRAVTAADIKRVANQYLTDNWFVLQVVPKAK
jgi:zinc protease